MDYVMKEPSRNLSRLLNIIETLDVSREHTAQLRVLRTVAEDPDNTWNRFIVRLCTGLDSEVLKTTVRNFILNASVLGMQEQAVTRKYFKAVPITAGSTAPKNRRRPVSAAGGENYFPAGKDDTGYHRP